ncbi:MAG TPA: xanthine dehydrogenase family protein molybdopterin-binding subunit [Candidatus Dormibacteraeota bacterium]|nr:xanthine dehydrogenase family protein molybdopterin-binding subunit [Candidatus Dormibacteraeota bacterium]
MSARAEPTGWVGRSLPRRQDPRLLTGRGRYAGDLLAHGMLHCAILRSPHAHARISRIDVSRARAMPGVVEVLTGREAKELSRPLPPTIDIGMKLNQSYAIAVDRVRYQGEPVAAVAALDPYVAEDALEAIEVEYEPLPALTSVEAALAPGAPLLYEEWGDNIELAYEMRTGDVEAALASADVVVEARVPHHRYTGAPLECRAVLAEYDQLSGELTVQASTQAPHQCRTLLAEGLGLPEQRVRVVAHDVGGGFGTKLQVDGEMIPCLLAIKTGRPVKWVESRRENLLSGVHSRDYVWDFRAGFTRDGRLTGLHARLTGDVGCDGTNRSSGVGALLVAAFYVPGAYKLPVLHVQVTGVVTNKAPYGAYRGYGKDIATYGIERLMEIAARRLHLPSDELRRRNFIQPDEYPFTTVTGPIHDSGDFPQLLSRAQELIGMEAFRRRQEEARRQGRHLGVGFSCMLEPSGAAVPNCIFNGYEPAQVRVTPEGGVILLTGLQDIGQGVETTLAQVVADELTLRPDDIKVVFGDTEAVPYGLGVWSSRGASYGVSAAVAAARRVKEKVLRAGANLLEVSPEDVELRAGAVQVKGSPERRLTLAEIGRAVYLWPGPYAVLPGEEPSLEASAYWTAPIVRWVPDQVGTLSIYTTHPTACFAAVVEVDVETGKVRLERMVVVHDCGTLINPMVVEGQISGGTVQGVAGALGEELAYDEHGNLLNLGFLDYLAPTAADLPPIEVEHLVFPSPFTALGSKGMGEGGAIGAPAAVVNAVEDALRPLGVTISEIPLTPERVLAAIEAAGGRS